MPVIYLKHPIHGNKVATMDLEADYDVTHGWEIYELDTQPEAVVEKLDEVLAAPVLSFWKLLK